MTISRPRASILSLFDPLTQVTEPSTPPRNNESPVFDSDKENDGPQHRTDLTLTTFFNKTYKPNHPLPKHLTRRLVDVGDVTVQDVDPVGPDSDDDEDNEAFEAALKEFDDDEGDTLTFRQIAVAATPKWNAETPKASGSERFNKFASESPSGAPRTPLGDLPIEEETTPVLRHHPMKRQTVTSPSKLSYVHIVVTEPEAEEDEPDTPVFANPSFGAAELQMKLTSTQPAPLATSQSSLNLSTLPNSADSLIAERSDLSISSSSFGSDFVTSTPSLEVPLRRRTPTSASSDDRNRYSCDLQSSFQMQINDSDASFDLLNDKISLFDSKCGMESNSHDFAEGTFDLDFEAAKLGAFAAAMQAQQDAAKGVPVNLEDEDFAPPPDADIFSPVKRQVTPVLADEAETVVPVAQLVEFVSPERKSAPVAAHTPSPRAASADVKTPVATPKNARPVVVPPPVAGLRIVKRSRAALEKAAEVNAVPPVKERAKRVSAPTSIASSRRQSVSTAEPVSSKTSSRSGSPPEPQVSARRTATTSSRSNPVPVPPVARRPMATDGPRRVLVEDQESSFSRPERLAAPTRVNSGRMASSNSTGPRRIIAPGASAPSIGMGALSRGTHSRQVSSSSTMSSTSMSTATTTTSGLPKPVSRTGSSSIPQPASRTASSRLPAPSAIVRPSTSREAGRNGPLRRVI
ncbi:hypothetical protein BKA70DRAFT_1417694 [Coprinopsis sp. MPI-PUGE-AT-0042]|nr:hypothetical protein BKA70DRAFT_1417694 [Coprinopsis sp. MPI-PUGE-AT-0042]